MSNQKHPSLDTVIAAGDPWMGIVRRGQLLRIEEDLGEVAVYPGRSAFYNLR